MSKRKGTQGAKGVEAKLEEEVVECSTSAASGECQEGSQHESEEGPEVRARKRWADVESDDEEEHFPGFGDLAEKTNVTTGTMSKQQEPETQVTNPKHTEESGDGKESVDEPAEEEWQEVTKKAKQPKPVQEDPARSVRRDRGRGGGDRRRKDGNGKDGKDGNGNDKEKKEGQARRRDPKSGAQGDEKGARRRGEQEKNGERKDQGKTREKKDAPKETWRKKNSEEDVQADKPKEGAGGAVEKKEVPKREGNEVPKKADAKVPAERKTEKRDSGRYHERQRKEPKENDSTQDGAPKAGRQNSGRTDGRRERGGRRPGGGNGNSQRASGPTAEDWFASRMQTAC